MEDHVKALQRTIKPGAKRLNWSSLGIQDYVTKCEEALTKFESLSNQVLKNAKDIEERLRSIESACLYKDPFADGGPDGKVMEAKVHTHTHTLAHTHTHTCTHTLHECRFTAASSHHFHSYKECTVHNMCVLVSVYTYGCTYICAFCNPPTWPINN